MHPSPALPIPFLEQHFPFGDAGGTQDSHMLHMLSTLRLHAQIPVVMLWLFHWGLCFPKSSLHFQFYLSCTGKITPDAIISSRLLQALLPLTRWKACGGISLPRLLSGVNGGQGLCALVQSQLWIVITSSWAPGASSHGVSQLSWKELGAPLSGAPGPLSLTSLCSRPCFLPGLFPHKYFLIAPCFFQSHWIKDSEREK